jgi:serpin B
MMHRTGTLLANGALPHAVIGILPFGGHDLSMAVVLPRQDGDLAAAEAELASADLPELLGDGGRVERYGDMIELALPKFALSSSYELPAALRALGITSAFDPQTANFAGIDGQRDLVLDNLIHKAKISVDETGAVAASGDVIRPVSLPAPFIVDNPLVFVIFDHVTKSILFLGRVSDPRAAE